MYMCVCVCVYTHISTHICEPISNVKAHTKTRSFPSVFSGGAAPLRWQRD